MLTKTSKIIFTCSLVAMALTFRDHPAAAQGAAACNNQPNMASALVHLRNAHNWLERAEHDKGGWRGNAVRSTDTAIRETERGCAFADTH
jgi:hypothetical protein